MHVLKNFLLFLTLSFSVLALAYGAAPSGEDQETPAPLEGYSVPPPPAPTELSLPRNPSVPAPLGAHSLVPAAPAPLAAHSIIPAKPPEPLEAHSVPVPPFSLGRPHDMLKTFEFTRSGNPLTPDQAEFLLSVYPKLRGKRREELDVFLQRAMQLMSEGLPAVSENSLAEDGDLMGAFMQAAQVLDSPGYIKMSDAVSGYVERNLYDKETGAFFDSRAGGRRTYPCPNARVALGYLRAYRTTGDRQYLSTARDLVDYVIKELKTPGRDVPASGQPMCQPSHIAARVYAGLAALQVYQATGEDRYLGFATETAWLLEGGIFAAGRESTVEGSRTALLLADLYDITGDKKHLQAARRILSGFTGVLHDVESWPAPYALAVERVGGGSYEFVVVGRVGDPGTAELTKKSYTFEDPDRVVVVLDPDRDKARLAELGYEYEEKAVLYVCSEKTCFPPVAPGESLAKTREVMKKALEMENR